MVPSGTSISSKRPATSPPEATSSKKMESTDPKKSEDTEKEIITLNSDSKNGQDMDQEEVNEPDEEAHFALDETFGQGFDDVAEGIHLMDLLQAMVTAIRLKTPSPTQARGYDTRCQNTLKPSASKASTVSRKILRTIEDNKKLVNKGSKDVARIQETITKEIAKIALLRTPGQQTIPSYASIEESGEAWKHPAKTKILLVYPKEENKKNQTSEEINLELQTRLQPKQMKLQINRISKIRNGGIALKVPIDRAEELDQVLKQKFETRAPKINIPKFKMFDVPASLDKEQFHN